jgi:hypothetical protein
VIGFLIASSSVEALDTTACGQWNRWMAQEKGDDEEVTNLEAMPIVDVREMGRGRLRYRDDSELRQERCGCDELF